MISKEDAIAIFSTKYAAWVESQKDQKDAYEYERSFDEFMQRISRDILQVSVGREPNARKKNGIH
jgi:Lon protease-like protein